MAWQRLSQHCISFRVLRPAISSKHAVLKYYYTAGPCPTRSNHGNAVRQAASKRFSMGNKQVRVISRFMKLKAAFRSPVS